jgi:hypothetical protein
MANVTTPVTDEELEIHRAVSDDGTEIAGCGRGNGPSLVLATGEEVNDS